MRQQRDGISGREVFARLFVILLVEAAQQLLKNGAHADVGHSGKDDAIGVFSFFVGKVDARVGNLLNDGQQAVVVSQLAGFIVVFEVLQHIAHILTEAVEVFDKVVVKDVVVVRSLRFQSVQCPFAGVEITQSSDVFQHAFIQIIQAAFLNFLFHFFLGRLKQGIKSA